jgi:hypothetical protein
MCRFACANLWLPTVEATDKTVEYMTIDDKDLVAYLSKLDWHDPDTAQTIATSGQTPSPSRRSGVQALYVDSASSALKLWPRADH